MGGGYLAFEANNSIICCRRYGPLKADTVDVWGAWTGIGLHMSFQDIQLVLPQWMEKVSNLTLVNNAA